jgi:hypothetical protein
MHSSGPVYTVSIQSHIPMAGSVIFRLAGSTSPSPDGLERAAYHLVSEMVANAETHGHGPPVAALLRDFPLAGGCAFWQTGSNVGCGR